MSKNVIEIEELKEENKFLKNCIKDLCKAIMGSFGTGLMIPSDSSLYQSANRIMNNFFYKKNGLTNKIIFKKTKIRKLVEKQKGEKN